MPNSTNRRLRKLSPVILNGGLSLMGPFINVMSSWLVIEWSGDHTWGEFVYILILTGLSMQVMNWGNREFLLRAFARHPDKAPLMWRHTLLVRGSLMFIALPVVLLSGLEMEAVSLVLLWILSGFIRQSFDVIVLFKKDFGFALLAEIVAAALLFGGLWLQRADLGIEDLLLWFTLAMVLRAIILGLRYGKEYIPGPWPRAQFRFFYSALPFFLLGFAGTLITRTDLYCVAVFLDDDSQLAVYQI
ncbi:MAG: hypothetical protein AAF570_18430, partial [Bacteroidota bacterium]